MDFEQPLRTLLSCLQLATSYRAASPRRWCNKYARPHTLLIHFVSLSTVHLEVSDIEYLTVNRMGTLMFEQKIQIKCYNMTELCMNINILLQIKLNV